MEKWITVKMLALSGPGGFRCPQAKRSVHSAACEVQLHLALSVSVVSKSVSKIPSLVALLAGTGTRLLLHSR